MLQDSRLGLKSEIADQDRYEKWSLSLKLGMKMKSPKIFFLKTKRRLNHGRKAREDS